MRRLLAIIISAVCITAYATDYSPAVTPVAAMQSVNNASYMSSGSSYTTTVYAVGSSSPFNAPGVRKAPPSVTPSTESEDYDPSNPQFAPLGDAVIPLLLMVMVYAAYIFPRRKKARMAP